MIGFSFALEEEAIKMISAVQSKLESRQRRREGNCYKCNMIKKIIHFI